MSAPTSNLHGCNVLYDLVRPWANTGCVVVADSYFASVQAAIRLHRIGLRFIGTVKTATKQFPMGYLGTKVMNDGRGDRCGLLAKDADSGATLMAFCWVDRDRRYFVSTCSSLAAGNPCLRWRWTQVDRTTFNAPPVFMEIVVQQPQACETYYSACAKIDQHNRYRQAALALERKLKTKVWWRRVNFSIFGMCVVDSYLLLVGCRGGPEHCGYYCAKSYFAKLAEELIDNSFDTRNLRKRTARAYATANPLAIDTDEVLDSHFQTIAPTPCKQYKRTEPTKRTQGRCMVCDRWVTHVCRECQRFGDMKSKQYFICNKEGKKCMGIHILQDHPHAVRGLQEDNAMED
jgi:Transposase IS4